MKASRYLLITLMTCGLLAACSDSDDPPVTVTPPPPPPPPAPTDFTVFVKDQFAATSDTSDPEPVDNEDFAFADEDNPNAFDDLLQ